MKKIIVISFIVLCSSMSLQADQKDYLAFSGGKFGYNSSNTATDSVPIDLNLRAQDHCHSTSWLRGKIRVQEWDWLFYRKISVTATSNTTFGTRRGSCNLPLKVPYISAKAWATAIRNVPGQPHLSDIPFIAATKKRILNNTSGLTARAKDSQWNTHPNKMYKPQMGYSEHVAKGGRIGKKVLRVNLKKKF